MSALRIEGQERLYRAYVTDALKTIAENTSKAAIPGVGVVDFGTVLTKRWAELAEPEKQKKEEAPEDNRPAREIAVDIWARIRGDK